jgi:outer membrane protein TolC
MNHLFLLFLICTSLVSYSQDSSGVFSYKSFISIVKEHHPVAYQAELTVQQGELYIAKARGGFDPKLKGAVNQKYFEEKQYYSYINGGLVIPTWFGATLQGGYNNNDGEFLSRESYTNPEGIWNAGVSINLGKGLFIDQRRADLKQAKYLKSSTELERNLVLNQLNYDASLAYFEWYKAYRKVLIYKESVVNADIRLQGVKESVVNGDKPAVDTLKANIQLQDRLLKLEQALVGEKNKKVWLNTFLWQEGFIPLELDTIVVPYIADDDLTYDPLLQVEKFIDNHPEVLIYNNDIEISKIDYRLKTESLKPTLELKYNALSSNSTYNVEDYNWGAKFSYPIFTRKERASVKIQGLKLEQKNTGLINKKEQVKYKILSSYNQLVSSNDQFIIQDEALTMYQKLFDSELTLFEIGESSLFMVNIREQNLIDSQVKLIDVLFQSQLANAIYNYHIFNF